jgi:hypothetical protein
VRGVGGTSTTPARTVSGNATINFPNTRLGRTNVQTVTVNNTGFVPVAVTSISLGAANANYWQQSNTCGSSIAVNANCTITITFAPPSAANGGTTGAHNSTLSIVDAVGTTTKTLNGTAN